MKEIGYNQWMLNTGLNFRAKTEKPKRHIMCLTFDRSQMIDRSVAPFGLNFFLSFEKYDLGAEPYAEFSDTGKTKIFKASIRDKIQTF